MKALILNICLSVFGLIMFTACNSGETNQNTAEQTETNQSVAGVTYTCPMHPEVVSDVKGKCPKCGMFLEEVKPGEKLDSAAAAQQHHHQEGEQH